LTIRTLVLFILLEVLDNVFVKAWSVKVLTTREMAPVLLPLDTVLTK